MIEEGGGPLRGFGEAPFPWSGQEVLNGVEEIPMAAADENCFYFNQGNLPMKK